MGHKSHIKAQRRNEKIAQVQRERDIAEVFGSDMLYDELCRNEAIDIQAFAPDGVISLKNVIIGEAGTCEFSSNVPHVEVDEDYNFPFETIWVEYEDWRFGKCGVLFRPIYRYDDAPSGKTFDGEYNKIASVQARVYTEFNDFDERIEFTPSYYEDDDTLQKFAHSDCDSTYVLFYLVRWKRSGHINWDNLKEAWGYPEAIVSEILHTLPCLTTLNNIELIDQPPNPRLSAISEREFGRPLTTYKVLKVNTSHKEYIGQDKDTGLRDFDPRRMHVVRGHHAEYGTNGRKLLFGKYTRKIWIPAHVRGNEELGIVVKDYEVVNGTHA